MKRCVATSDCKSINYKKQGEGNNCFLNKKNRKEAGEAAIEANENFVYYNIDYHTQRSEEPEFGTANINMVSGTTRKIIYSLYLLQVITRKLRILIRRRAIISKIASHSTPTT